MLDICDLQFALNALQQACASTYLDLFCCSIMHQGLTNPTACRGLAAAVQLAALAGVHDEDPVARIYLKHIREELQQLMAGHLLARHDGRHLLLWNSAPASWTHADHVSSIPFRFANPFGPYFCAAPGRKKCNKRPL